MTSGTWDRHRGHSSSYDVVGLGYNYRLDELHAALLHARLPRLADDVSSRRRIVHRYRELLSDVAGVTLPYDDADVEHASCYVMPVMLDDPALRDPLRDLLREQGIQTSVLYPAIHEFTAYRNLRRGPLPRSELAARTQVTLPLYPHLTELDQDRVVGCFKDGIARLRGEPVRLERQGAGVASGSRS